MVRPSVIYRRLCKLHVTELHDQFKPGRPSSHDGELIADLLKIALTGKPQTAMRRLIRSLTKSTAVSESAVQRYLALFGVQARRPKTLTLPTDPFLVEKVRHIVELYLNSLDHALVSCSGIRGNALKEPETGVLHIRSIPLWRCRKVSHNQYVGDWKLVVNRTLVDCYEQSKSQIRYRRSCRYSRECRDRRMFRRARRADNASIPRRERTGISARDDEGRAQLRLRGRRLRAY